jgi:hypothetical protein
MGERGGYSPSATASSCENGGNAVGEDIRSPENGVTLNIGFMAGCLGLEE